MDKQPNQEEIEEKIRHAFKEFLMSGELLGLQISHGVSDVLWLNFYRYLKWRLDKLYEPDIKQHTKKQLKAIQKKVYGAK